MNKANVICFLSTPRLVKQLKDLQVFYGQKTRSKLLAENIVPEALIAVYKNPMPKGLSPEQKKAYRRIVKIMNAIHKLAVMMQKIERERKETSTQTGKTKKRKQGKLKTKKK